MAAVNVGVMGGTFDPVHLGHLVLVERVREQFDLERVLWVPAGDPWRKAAGPVTAGEHRLAMVRLAIAGHPAFEVSTLELERAGPSYSVETLAALHTEHPEEQLVFLLGQDALNDLPNWHEPERLLQIATLAVAPRSEGRPSAEELDALVPGLSEHVVWVEMPRIDISATELRRRAAAGHSLRYLVPDAVEAYIREQRLYHRA